jgi:hypothetical protein
MEILNKLPKEFVSIIFAFVIDSESQERRREVYLSLRLLNVKFKNIVDSTVFELAKSTYRQHLLGTYGWPEKRIADQLNREMRQDYNKRLEEISRKPNEKDLSLFEKIMALTFRGRINF